MSIQILLATYNGEAYLDQQLQSLANQTYTDFSLLVIDDGSADSTRQILQNWSDRLPITILEQEKHLGLPAVFFQLLSSASQDNDYFAFCDQDDIWLPEKLENAIRDLAPSPTSPALWVCSFSTVNETDNILNLPYEIGERVGVGNALVECIGPGCAMVWNNSLMSALQVPDSTKVLMHDWWLYASATAIGTVRINKQPLIRYRIHGRNSIGIDTKLTSRVRRVIAAKRSRSASLESQASEVLRLYGIRMQKEDVTLIKHISEKQTFGRLSDLFHRRLYRQKRKDNLLLALRLLFP